MFFLLCCELSSFVRFRQFYELYLQIMFGVLLNSVWCDFWIMWAVKLRGCLMLICHWSGENRESLTWEVEITVYYVLNFRKMLMCIIFYCMCSVKLVVFWVLMLHSDVVGYQLFGRHCFLHLYPEYGRYGSPLKRWPPATSSHGVTKWNPWIDSSSLWKYLRYVQ
jgi:hypothetical protein